MEGTAGTTARFDSTTPYSRAQQRMTAVPLLLGATLIAGALMFHAAFPRYDVRPMQGLLVVRTDRWTGAIQLCRSSLTLGGFVCGEREIRRTPNPE